MTSTMALPMHEHVEAGVGHRKLRMLAGKRARLAARSVTPQPCLGDRSRRASIRPCAASSPSPRPCSLAGCATAAASSRSPQPPPPHRRDAAEPQRPHRPDRAASWSAHFGNPALQVREGAGLKLQFRGRAACSTPISIRRRGGDAARHLCRYARCRPARDIDQAACIAALEQRRAAPAPSAPLRRPPGRDRRDAAARPRPAAGSPLLPAAIRQLRIIRLRADPLDRRAGEHLAEAGIVEREQVGEPRRGQLGARQEGAVGRARRRRSGSTGRPRGNRRSRRCGCRSPRGTRRGIGPSCSIVR